jgi:exodeoxyribonuclease-5
MTDLTWSPQQDAALLRVDEWLKDPTAPPIFRLFGYAGTGKTTLAKHLAFHVRNPIFAAFTGKAASVLREKGCPGAQTLHSLLYNVQERDKAKLRELEAALKAMEPGHPDRPELNAEYTEELDKVKRPWFYVNPDSALGEADLLVVDEVSMVDQRIGEDIMSFKKKVLVLGDPAQLPPVRGGGYFTECKPDILLTEIHRQALDNPILRWATLARQGHVIPYADLGLAKKFRRDQIDDAWLAAAGQILCGKNDTRHDLNRRIRKQLGRTSLLPVEKDVLVMLMNDNKLGVLNGTICHAQCDAVVDAAHPEYFWLNIKYPTDSVDGKARAKILFDQKVDAGPFQGKECTTERRALQADYGYALTVHKAQGSEWPSVVVYDDGFGKREADVRKRWLYTAITRAGKQLYIVTS